jgi:hypothetical protein
VALIEPLFKHSVTAETITNEVIAASSGEFVSSEYTSKATAELAETSYLETVAAFFSETAEKLESGISPIVSAQKTSADESKQLSGETITIDGAGAGFTIPAGKFLTVTFKATVNDGPFNAGVNNISNNATVTGSPSVNVTTNMVSVALDLEVTTTDLGVKTQPGGIVSYTVKTQNALGVVVTHVVPGNTTFNAAASTAGWSCANGAPAGTSCTFTVGAERGRKRCGDLCRQRARALPADFVQVAPTVTIADNGANGADLNAADNTGTETTPVVGNWLGDTSSTIGLLRQTGATAKFRLRATTSRFRPQLLRQPTARRFRRQALTYRSVN